MEGFRQLEKKYIEARLRFNLYKEQLDEPVRRSVPKTNNQRERDKEQAKMQEALDTAA